MIRQATLHFQGTYPGCPDTVSTNIFTQNFISSCRIFLSSVFFIIIR
jgi:hypothetical protein